MQINRSPKPHFRRAAPRQRRSASQKIFAFRDLFSTLTASSYCRAVYRVKKKKKRFAL